MPRGRPARRGVHVFPYHAVMPSKARLMRAAKTRARRVAEGQADGATAGGGVRLQRVMADAGVAARRVCEQMIEAGRVSVNGEVVSRLPVFVDPARDKVTVDGRVVTLGARGRGREAGGPGRVYVMLHKPERVMTTLRDDGGRTTVADLVKREGPERLFPVGRLDFHASGLVLLTNDGELANRLTHARYGVAKTYHLSVRGTVSAEQLTAINTELGYEPPPAITRPPTGVRAEGAPPPPPPAIIWSRAEGAPERADMNEQRAMGKAKTVVRVTVTPRRYLNLPDLFLRCGLSVLKVVQVGVGGVGGLEMKGLAVGAWRELTRDEAGALRVCAGLDEPRAVRKAGGRPARTSRETHR